MNFNEILSMKLRNLPIKDYEKRTFNLRRYLENGYL
mgnify:CR=1 FL=1